MSLESLKPLELTDFADLEFDFQAAFNGAISDVATNTELALDEKVLRIENILAEGDSEAYRSFVDMRAIVTNVEMNCAHDHALGQALEASNSYTGLRDSFKTDEHGHSHTEPDEEIDPVTKKKKKKKKTASALSQLFARWRSSDN